MSDEFYNQSYDKLESLYKYMYTDEGIGWGFGEPNIFENYPNPYKTDLSDDEKALMKCAFESNIHYFLKHIMRVSTKKGCRGLFEILPWQKIFTDIMSDEWGTPQSVCVLGYNKFAHKSTMMFAYLIYQLISNENETAHIFVNGDTDRAEDRIRHLVSCLPKGFISAMKLDIPNLRRRFKFFDATIYDTTIHANTSNTESSKTIVLFDEFPLTDPKMGDIIQMCYHEDGISDAPSVIITSSIYNDQNVLHRKDYSARSSFDLDISKIYKDGINRAIYTKNGFTYIDTALVNIMINRHLILNNRDNEEDKPMTSLFTSRDTKRIAGSFEKISEGSAIHQVTDIDVESVKRMRDDLKLPARATSGSAGYDFYAPSDIELHSGVTLKIPTFIKCKMNEGWVLQIYPRSSLGFKYRIQLDNTVGIIDQDYYNNESNEGHIFIKISMDSYDQDKVCIIKAGEAFAQGIFMQYGITENDDATSIRIGGTGSTNKNEKS